MRKIFLLIFIFSIISKWASSQRQWLYMTNNYQTGYINPAYIANKEWQIALPDFNINAGLTGINIAKVVRREGDSYKINPDDLINNIDDKINFYGAVDINILGLGRRMGNGYFSAGYGLRSTGNSSMEKELARLLLKGNESFIGKEQNFTIALQYQIMHQIYLGYAHQIGPLNLGIKLKYLNGISSLNSTNSNISLNTLEHNYETLVKNNLNIYASFPITLDKNFSLESPTIDLSKNFGYGIDLGLEYQVTENTSIMASAIDIGRINWNDKVYQYSKIDETLVRGLNIQDLIDGKNASIEDTISSLYELKSLPNGNFTTQLTSGINLGGKHEINKYSFAALFSSQFYSYGTQTNLSLMSTMDLSKYFTLGLSYTYRDAGHYGGLSAGVNLGPVKMVVATQNILQPLDIKHLQAAQLIAGFSIEFGKIKTYSNEEY